MADHLVNGIPLVDGVFSLPRTGLWVADVQFSGGEGVSVGDRAEFEAAGVTRIGTVIRADNAYLTPRARIVGGAGKLYTELSARDYRGYMLGRIAQDAMSDAGEQYDSSWTSVLSQQVLHYTRAQGPLAHVMRSIVKRCPADYTWRVQRDGVWALVQETYTERTPSAPSEIASWPQEDRVLVGPITTEAEPGMVISVFGVDRRIDRVVYYLSAEEFRADIWYLPDEVLT
jgi:hypothetical protein